MRELVADLVRLGRFTPVAPYQRVAYVCGALLVASGLFHGVVYLVDGGSWEGPVSWRKPIVFGLSFGIALRDGDLVARLPADRGRWAGASSASSPSASVGEVFLISMQKWRGVPSHFNEDTAFDEWSSRMMGMLVTLVAA